MIMPRQFITALKAETEANSPGSLLTVANVRRRANMPKFKFDAIAIALAHEGVVTLTEHDAPYFLTVEGRELLVWNPQSNRYFNGIYLNR